MPYNPLLINRPESGMGTMAHELISRNEIGERFLENLPFEPYPVQEEALLAWFTAEQGVLVCAPTGTGKTLIAHAALYEALQQNQLAYYTTPLIALTEQKFHELQQQAVRWGFAPDQVGLVTGNRRVNPDARILVVVAEILLNRLLNPVAFDFSTVSSVVMDEFHSFNDPERGIVWELTLGLLPHHVRLMLLSATVGNARDFLYWLERCHNHKLELVEDTHRRVPLEYQWVPDRFLGEQLEAMAQGAPDQRTTPALVFCFNREECWAVAEQLKGLDLLSTEQRKILPPELARYDWSTGIGAKLRQLLQRGVAVHHAGMLPKYRRIVERLYESKLLGVCVCTETLAAGINLPARSVVLTSLMKGPFGKKKIIGSSVAHQIFGRAGRPQFDSKGYVFALAHEDDVRILRWRQKYDAIPETTKDPNLLKVKKALWKKRPTRRENEQYWNAEQFAKLIASPPARLASAGPLPWRLLAYLLQKSPEVDRLRALVRKRLMEPKQLDAAEVALDRMLLSLFRGGFVTLDPLPPQASEAAKEPATPAAPAGSQMLLAAGLGARPNADKAAATAPKPVYRPMLATPTPALDRLLVFRSIHPIYGAFLLEHLGIANEAERIQALESVLELPRSIWRSVRVPLPEELPPGPLASTRLDPELVQRGLISARILADGADDEDDDNGEEDEHPPVLADKLRMLFEATYPDVHDVRTQAVWAAGELLRFGGDFDKYVRTCNLVKQEGLVFRHFLRLVLLCGEFAVLCPPDVPDDAWQTDLRNLACALTAACRRVDPETTEKLMVEARAADLVEGEARAAIVGPPAVVSEADWRADWERQWDEMLASLTPG